VARKCRQPGGVGQLQSRLRDQPVMEPVDTHFQIADCSSEGRTARVDTFQQRLHEAIDPSTSYLRPPPEVVKEGFGPVARPP
jgi:hypothetical protein